MQKCKDCNYKLIGTEKKCPKCGKILVFKCKDCGKELLNGINDRCVNCRKKFANKLLILLAILCVLAPAAIIVSVVYFLIPLDIAPDFIVGYGWVDDIIVAVVLSIFAICGGVTATIFGIKASRIKKSIKEENGNG